MKKKIREEQKKRIEQKKEKAKVHDVVFEIPKYIYQNFIEQCFSVLKIKYSNSCRVWSTAHVATLFGNKP